MKTRISILIVLTTFNLLQSQQKKIEVLIVDGFSNHDWEQTTLVTRRILESSDLFNITVSTMPLPNDSKNWKKWQPKFKGYDVVIQNCNNIHDTTLVWPRNVKRKLEKYVKSGGGLYVLHSANNAFAKWKAYNDMIGLGWRNKYQGVALQVSDNGNILRIKEGEGQGTYHGPRHDEVIYKLHNHPINKGYPKAWKTPNMELYKYARGPAENIKILSYAKDDETNINWPVDWVVIYGKGRVYNSSMGHLWKGEIFPDSYRCIGFQTTLIRAVEWLATGKTIYSIPDNFPTFDTIKMVPKNTLNFH